MVAVALAKLRTFRPPSPRDSSTRVGKLGLATLVTGTTVMSSAHRLSQSTVSTNGGPGSCMIRNRCQIELASANVHASAPLRSS